jgi:hypothetical protein
MVVSCYMKGSVSKPNVLGVRAAVPKSSGTRMEILLRPFEEAHLSMWIQLKTITCTRLSRLYSEILVRWMF